MRQLTSLAEVPERGNAHFSIDATFVLRGTTAPPHRLRNRRGARRTPDTRTRRAGSGPDPRPDARACRPSVLPASQFRTYQRRCRRKILQAREREARVMYFMPQSGAGSSRCGGR